MNTKLEGSRARACWFVGAMYGGTDDQMPRFFKEGFWLFLAASLFLVPISAWADSLNIENDHYAGGPVIVIKLTDKQKERVDKKYKPYNKMKLTKGQQDEIASKAKMKEPPTQVIVVRPADTQGDCTCGLANIGLILKGGMLEIPVSYLATDKEAKEMEIVD